VTQEEENKLRQEAKIDKIEKEISLNIACIVSRYSASLSGLLEVSIRINFFFIRGEVRLR
jgi:hypothetical protein